MGFAYRLGHEAAILAILAQRPRTDIAVVGVVLAGAVAPRPSLRHPTEDVVLRYRTAVALVILGLASGAPPPVAAQSGQITGVVVDGSGRGRSS